METPTTWIGLLFTLGVLTISSIGVWVLEYRRHQTSKKGNGYLKNIADTLKELDEKQDAMKEIVVETKTKVEAQANHCESTVSAVFKAIDKNSDRIFTMKGKQKK